MKKFLNILSIVILSSFSLAHAQTEAKEPSPYIKEAIVSCLETTPKTTDNKTSRELVKKCLETKGIQTQKEDSNLSPSLREKQNEALKQCHSNISSNDKKSMHECLQSKGVQ